MQQIALAGDLMKGAEPAPYIQLCDDGDDAAIMLREPKIPKSASVVSIDFNDLDSMLSEAEPLTSVDNDNFPVDDDRRCIKGLKFCCFASILGAMGYLITVVSHH